ncbi:hypothetical protein CCYA_CCYA09G2542 [Cyanidiococcus yangmingshanensis]|nr:hypothetical protein CCYA_CCYA09G2542 [Cyanidiococcus yangmingshanensis]
MFVVAYRITVTPFSSNNVRVTCTSDQRLYQVQRPALRTERYAALRQCIGKEGPFTAVFRRDQLERIARDGALFPEADSESVRKPPRRSAETLTDEATKRRFMESLRCALEAFHFIGPMPTGRYLAANVFRVRYVRAMNDSAARDAAFVLNAIDEAETSMNDHKPHVDSLVYVSHQTDVLVLHLPRSPVSEASSSTDTDVGGHLLLVQGQRGVKQPTAHQQVPPDSAVLPLEENMLITWRGDAWYRFANVSEEAAWVQLEQYVIDPKELPRFDIHRDPYLRAG